MASLLTQGRTDQHELLRWVLGALRAFPTTDASAATAPPPLPKWPLERFAAAGLASGLTAIVGALAARTHTAVPAAWQTMLADQQAQVLARHHRFAALAPQVLAALHDAGVSAAPLKGAVLADHAWPVPGTRPMADLDLLIEPCDRASAADALVAAGLTLHASRPWEDTFLAWGDGSRGRIDGESAAHNGKVELHPGWREHLHGYDLSDGDALTSQWVQGSLGAAPCRRLPPAALAAQVIGHLSAGVVRAEVRAVNVIDVLSVLGLLDPPALGASAPGALGPPALGALAELLDALDPRLSEPGLWLVSRFGALPDPLRSRPLRLGRTAARHLDAAGPAAVLRDVHARTTVAWRLSFARASSERVAVLRQALAPTATDLGGTPADAGPLRFTARRLGRATRRLGRATRRLLPAAAR